MPELPDVLLYLSALNQQLAGKTIRRVSVRSPSLLRTFTPPLENVIDRQVTEFSRCGKRIVWHIEGGLYLVFHLMIAGRFHWKKKAVLTQRKNELAAFGFDHGHYPATLLSA